MPEKPRYKLPQLLQSVEAESGAVALGIALACHGKTCTLRELSSASGVTRDGTTPEKLVKAAESFGLSGKWERLSNDETTQNRPRGAKARRTGLAYSKTLARKPCRFVLPLTLANVRLAADAGWQEPFKV